MIIFLVIVFLEIAYCAPYRTAYRTDSVSHASSDAQILNYPKKLKGNKIKECNQRLDRCLAQCDGSYPEYSKAIDPLHAECRDNCVVRLKSEEGCLIFYQSTRRVLYRSEIIP